MKSTDAPENLRPFIFHGVDLIIGDANSTGDCPFCKKERKFNVKTDTGQFRCLYCEETGNIYSFLFRLHQQSTEGTSKKGYDQLAKLRGVSPASLQYFGLAKSAITGEWLIPAYNTKGNLSNLYRVVQRKDETGKTRLAPMSTPGCKPAPFGTNHLVSSPRDTVWVTEGVWDGCAMYDAINASKQLEAVGILPVPGCGNFSADWLELFDGKEMRVVFDNDYPKKYPVGHDKAGELIKQKGKVVRPGWDGMERIAKLVGLSKHRPSKLMVMFWNGDEEGHNPNLKDGFDIGDLVKDYKAKNKNVELILDFLEAGLQQVKISSPRKKGKQEKDDEPAIQPLECESYEDLCKHWASVLHFTQQLRDTLAIMLSVVLSTESEKVNHLWLRVIGPPGSGKSTLAEAISVAREWVSPKSLVTGFHSGFVDPNDPDSSASLIPELDNKTVIMKDADTLANSPGRDKILSELRDLYDGTSRAHYRHMKQEEFEDVRLSFILCGTDELRQLNRSFLGERFLDCEIMARNEDASPYLQRAADNTYASLAGFLKPKEDTTEETIPVDRMMLLKQYTYGFIKYMKENYRSFSPPRCTPEALGRIQAMGEYVALMRARVRHDHNDSSFRPRPELPTRLTSQFTKLAFFIAIVLRKESIDNEVLRLVLKVVHDTSVGMQQELTEALAADQQDLGTAVRQMVLTLNVPETSARRQLNDMRQFQIAQPYTASNNSGQRGRDRHLWVLSPNMRRLWNVVHGLNLPPENKPNAKANKIQKPKTKPKALSK